MLQRVVLAILLVTLFISAAYSANVPEKINFQGTLMSGGAPVANQSVNMTFKLFATETGGTQIWTEDQVVETDGNGVYNVKLGAVTSLDCTFFDGVPRYLEIIVEGEVMGREELVSVPYAMRVCTVDGATGGSISGDVYLSSGDLYLDRAYPKLRMHYGSYETLDFSGKISFYRDDGMGGSVEKAQIWMDESLDDNALLINPGVPNDIVLGLGGGDVGIGTASPNSKLDVQGDISVRRTSDGQLTSWISSYYNKGFMALYNQAGNATIWIDADKYDACSQIALKNASGQNTIELMAQDWGDRVGALNLLNGAGQIRLHLSAANDAGTDGSKFEMWNSSGERVIQFVAQRETGFPPLERGWVITEALEITGGSDLSEQFNIGTATDGLTPTPGMVVSIDPAQPGKLCISDSPYDHMVAGIISGAGDVAPGMLMGQKGSAADGDLPVALTGRVYCLADAANGPIQPGDLLTSSGTPGHAMKVTNHELANGAIIGKAMTSLDEGTGLVLVLVSLQ